MTAREKVCQACMFIKPAKDFYVRNLVCKSCRNHRLKETAMGRHVPKLIKPPRWPMPALLRSINCVDISDLGARLSTVGLNTPQHRLQRWGETGIPDHQADRLAIAVGYHPSEIWPSWWEYGLAIKEETE